MLLVFFNVLIYIVATKLLHFAYPPTNNLGIFYGKSSHFPCKVIKKTVSLQHKCYNPSNKTTF